VTVVIKHTVWGPVHYWKDQEPCGPTCVDHRVDPCPDCGRIEARGMAPVQESIQEAQMRAMTGGFKS
jgi:hypothetical protein